MPLKNMPVVTVEQVTRFREAAIAENAALLELVRLQHEALSVLAEANDNEISGGFMTAEEVGMYRAALAKYNEMMGDKK